MDAYCHALYTPLVIWTVNTEWIVEVDASGRYTAWNPDLKVWLPAFKDRETCLIHWATTLEKLGYKA